MITPNAKCFPPVGDQMLLILWNGVVLLSKCPTKCKTKIDPIEARNIAATVIPPLCFIQICRFFFHVSIEHSSGVLNSRRVIWMVWKLATKFQSNLPMLPAILARLCSQQLISAGDADCSWICSRGWKESTGATSQPPRYLVFSLMLQLWRER